MKKSLFVLGVAVAALASCTNEEVLNVAESNQIRFGTSFVGNQTKTAPVAPNTTALTEFWVYAGNAATENADAAVNSDIFENVRVYKNSANEWVYDAYKEWDKETNTHYKFAAYAGTPEQLTTTTNVTFDWPSGLLSFDDIEINGEKQYDLLAS